ncbi:GAF domain-containing protein [Weissella sagaensis]|jgi:GAF domain-containing protein|uniref:GAF domain-containing protein n=1 Tax=Weissella sagaensis TaxID=2559928 RepID=A0ABW1RS86_9LACO|nr:GAF domain-containing protein [Weissella sagaensis]KAA8432990.1 GAF domain-containing protein [Weissella paramesenteroides]QDJ58154.1 GAF domain-containing protein [Weissella hellenica]KAA8435914.1 GAF domain-containing protein [Weissella paramesenteroides]QEA57151.1 GAF domain-containing protein [Weissella hellenica]UEG66265.1 GAF domain-containing protein [Weissella hellenica]
MAEQVTPLLSQLLTSWISGEESEELPLANLSNAAAILFENLADVNWAGFYLYNPTKDELILGPFLGKPAVVRIKPGSGVVGQGYNSQESIIVADVHQHPGHIACDSASNAEIVIPLTRANGEKLGVIDIDSTRTNRFTDQDKADLEHFAQTLLAYI